MNKKQELEKRATALETELAALRSSIESMPSDTPERWVPELGAVYWLIDSAAVACSLKFYDSVSDQSRLSIGNVHRTKEDAEACRLRLESFVPCYGYEIPSEEVLDSGWLAKWNDGPTTDKCNRSHYRRYITAMYLQGAWHPTREAAEAWLEKYGKVRGYRS